MEKQYEKNASSVYNLKIYHGGVITESFSGLCYGEARKIFRSYYYNYQCYCEVQRDDFQPMTMERAAAHFHVNRTDLSAVRRFVFVLTGIIGFLLILGAAGSSDLDLVPVAQTVKQSLTGGAFMISGFIGAKL